MQVLTVVHNKGIKMQKDNLYYQDLKINDSNVHEFIQKQHFAQGHFDRFTGNITIFNFVVENVSDPSMRAAAHEYAMKIKNDEAFVLAHELRHRHNNNTVGIPEGFEKNNYELISLLVLDEVSANTAGFLYAEPRITSLSYGLNEKIILSLHAATQTLLSNQYLEMYLKKYNELLTLSILKSLEQQKITYSDLRKMRELEKNSPKDLFSSQFHAAVKKYLTFEDVYLFEKKYIPAYMRNVFEQTKKNIQEIKSKCVSMVSKTLEEAIDMELVIGMKNSVYINHQQKKK